MKRVEMEGVPHNDLLVTQKTPNQPPTSLSALQADFSALFSLGLSLDSY
jgi:hypothetical protein